MKAFEFNKIIRGISKNSKNYINNELKNLPINEGQLEYLFIIKDNPNINQLKIAEIMNVGKAATTKAVNKLMSKNLITKDILQKDKRNYKLKISPRGENLLNRFNNIENQIESIIFNNLDNKSKNELEILLTKILKNSKKL